MTGLPGGLAAARRIFLALNVSVMRQMAEP